MKRFTVVNIVLLACTLPLGAQAAAQAEFGVGPIGGVNFSTTSISPPASYPTGVTQGGRTGMMVGIQAELGFTNSLYLLIQPLYVQKGYTLNGVNEPAVFAVNEFEVPLVLKVKFLDGVFRPYVYAGPNLSIVLSTIESYSYPGLNIPDQDWARSTSTTDFAIDFGAGAEFYITPLMGITGDFQYSAGLKSLMGFQPNTEGMSVTTKASGFQILVGAMFHVM